MAVAFSARSALRGRSVRRSSPASPVTCGSKPPSCWYLKAAYERDSGAPSKRKGESGALKECGEGWRTTGGCGELSKGAASAGKEAICGTAAAAAVLVPAVEASPSRFSAGASPSLDGERYESRRADWRCWCISSWRLIATFCADAEILDFLFPGERCFDDSFLRRVVRDFVSAFAALPVLPFPLEFPPVPLIAARGNLDFDHFLLIPAFLFAIAPMK